MKKKKKKVKYVKMCGGKKCGSWWVGDTYGKTNIRIAA